MPAYPHKYCISWISFFDNELNMDFCYATSTQHALVQAYKRLFDEEWNDEGRDLDIKQAAFDSDGMISAICCD